jgi:hypothetical protein
MAIDWGIETGTTGFSATVQTLIQRQLIESLRAGLIALPKGSVRPAILTRGSGHDFTLRMLSYPDLDSDVATVPLTEGVPPDALQLGIDSQDFSVQQVGAVTSLTDVAQFQSGDNLPVVAARQIARLAAQTIDNLALALLLAHPTDRAAGVTLSTSLILDAKAGLQSKNAEPVPGVGFYCLLHPNALRGLEGEGGIAGYVDVTSEAANGDLSKGSVSQYRGITFITSTKFGLNGSSEYPCIFLPANAIAFGDVSTVEFLRTSGGPVIGDPLHQSDQYGFKGILGGALISVANSTDGSGSLGADASRIWTTTVTSGVGTGVPA